MQPDFVLLLRKLVFSSEKCTPEREPCTCGVKWGSALCFIWKYCSDTISLRYHNLPSRYYGVRERERPSIMLHHFATCYHLCHISEGWRYRSEPQHRHHHHHHHHWQFQSPHRVSNLKNRGTCWGTYPPPLFMFINHVRGLWSGFWGYGFGKLWFIREVPRND